MDLGRVSRWFMYLRGRDLMFKDLEQLIIQPDRFDRRAHPMDRPSSPTILLGAIGSNGMVAGQVVDMESEGGDVDEATVEFIHMHKTAALIEAAGRCGALVAGAGEALIERISLYGRKLGLAFQITDDILDAEGRFGNLKAGSSLDKRRRKATYPSVFGLDRSREIASRLVGEAKDSVADMGEGALPLLSMADLVIGRSS